jgi:hypothetical protein
MAKATTTKTVHRSSESGKFVTKSYTQSHPRTTETERVKVPVQHPKPKGR